MGMDRNIFTGRCAIYLSILAAALMAAASGCQSKPKQAREDKPPVVDEAIILPEQPTYDAQVSLKVTALDPDGDQVFYKIEWLVNGQVAASGSNVQFSTKGLAVGDRISARILPSDGIAEGQWYQTEEVILWPKILSLDSLKIDPSPLTSGLEQVVALPFVAIGVDLDQLRFVYKWTLDGKALSDSGPLISVPPLKVGQKIMVEATPILGQKKGNPYRTMATVVGAPPIIKSVTFLRQEGEYYLYRVEAQDPNGEPLNFSLVKANPGISLNPSTGELKLPVNSSISGTRIRVANGSGSFVEKELGLSP